MMHEDHQAAKHNHGECQECFESWEGPTAMIEATFHEMTTGHPIEVGLRVICHDGCCEIPRRRYT